MKTILNVILSVLLFSSAADAATWTFHAARQNYTRIIFSVWQPVPDQNPGSGYVDSTFYCYWNYAYDIAKKKRTASQHSSETMDFFTGVWPDSPSWSSETVSSSYSDDITCEVAVDEGQTMLWQSGRISGPYPSFYGGSNFTVDLYQSQEWWIDFGPGGVARIQSYRPYDFGKWNWDGSINPNWVPPVLYPVHGRGNKKVK